MAKPGGTITPPHNYPKQHTAEEEALIRKVFPKYFYRYGWEEVYRRIRERGYKKASVGWYTLLSE